MAMLLIAARACDGGYFVTRILLPAGVYHDTLANDLRVNFEGPEYAVRLCSDQRAIRGLPSEGAIASTGETQTFGEIPSRIADLERLQTIADEAGIYSVLVHTGDGWFKLGPDGTTEDINQLHLYELVA